MNRKTALNIIRCNVLFSNLFRSLSLFLDTGALTAPLTLEVDLRPADAAGLIQLDRLDIGREQGEGPFHTYSIGDLPHRERGRMAVALTLDHVSLEALDTFLVAFNDLIIDSDIITGFKLRKLDLSR